MYDSKAALVYRRRVGNFRGNDLIVIPSEKFPSGMYWIHIQKDDNPAIIKKVIK
jgi:hypothetical protein